MEAVEAVRLMSKLDQQKKQEDVAEDESKDKPANQAEESRKTLNRGDSRKQFYRDEGKICQFYLDGYCKHGDECQDIHDNGDEQYDHKSRRRSTKEKPKQVRGGSLEKESQSQPKTHLCQFFLQNRCRFGRYCKNDHPDLVRNATGSKMARMNDERLHKNYEGKREKDERGRDSNSNRERDSRRGSRYSDQNREKRRERDTREGKRERNESYDKSRGNETSRKTNLQEESTSRIKMGGKDELRDKAELSMQKRMDFLEEGMKKISRFITQNKNNL